MTPLGENVLFKVFGVANVFPNPGRTRKILNYVYRVFFLLILLHTPRGVIKIQYNVIKTGNIVLSTKVFIEIVTYWLTIYVSYVNLLFHDGKITWVKSSLTEMAGILRMTKAGRRRLVFALWLVILLLLTCQITYYILGILLSGTSVIVSVSYFLNKFTVNLINYQFCYLLWIIRYFLREVNERLRLLLRRMKSEQGNGVEGRTNTRNLHIREIYQLKTYHTTLTSITKALSEAYSLHILFIVASGVVESICSLNGLLFVAESCQGNTKCVYNNTFNSLLWYCNFSAPVFIMVFTCSWVTDEAGKTQKLVLDIELESHDEALISLLLDFSLNLRLNRFVFTGYGCFEVNREMILTNASTALTYLIIQKQFAFDGLYTTYTGF